jgi:uncharacterized protein (DUF4415 family)
MNNSARRTAGEPLTPDQLHELQQLAAMPDDQIDFSDIPESSFETPAPMQEHTVTLRLDPDVAAWLESSAKVAPQQINLLLKRLARRTAPSHQQVILEKAS